VKVDLKVWGPLTWLIVATVVIAEVFIGLYLVIAQPSTDDIAKLVGAGAAILTSPAVLAIAHAILKGKEMEADAIVGVRDEAVANAGTPVVSDRDELGAVVRPDEARTPDPAEGPGSTDPDARLA
jgi:hypothetical protein